jgi:hypothetical protein
MNLLWGIWVPLSGAGSNDTRKTGCFKGTAPEAGSRSAAFAQGAGRHPGCQADILIYNYLYDQGDTPWMIS